MEKQIDHSYSYKQALEAERALSDQLADALVLVRLGMHQVGAGKGNILFDAVNNALASYNKARGK